MHTQPTQRLYVGKAISQAWSLVSGSKAAVSAALGITFLISIFFSMLAYILLAAVPFLRIPVNLSAFLLYFLMKMGLLNIGLERSKNKPVTFDMLFRCF